ncbi:MAG: efflux RND transporter periplasmic adaptor subunit [Acidobacteriota bacterium]
MKTWKRTLPVFSLLILWPLGVGAEDAATISAKLVEVISRPLGGSTVLPGELRAYRTVETFARVSGFVESVRVDRGSRTRKGEMLATLTAPEMQAQIAEAHARVAVAEAQRAEAEAKRAALEATFERLGEAAQTPGAVAGNELVQAEKALEAERARVVSLDKSVEAARANLAAAEKMMGYLKITADFDGVVTERLVHEGSLVGPASKGALPLFRLEQIGRLRLVVAVPESLAGEIRRGVKLAFTVSAYPGEQFSGVVARPALSLDPKTRTMPVELDVANPGTRLAPGMYAEVVWPKGSRRNSLLVPASAIKATTEQTFVIRVTNGTAEWVAVRRGSSDGSLVEVFSELKPGDKILQRATDEVRPGTRITTK